ncbi:MAG: hypothetical protein EXS05_08425 [Planctomycetaceae bacterium]|nr:hypothetical protein [Planctomycetaceae bacterium]
MPDAIAFFAIRLIVGIAWVLWLMPRKQVAAAYFRIQMLLILGLSVLFGLTSPNLKWYAAALAVTSFAGSVMWLLERRRAGAVAIGVIAIAGWIVIALVLPATEAPEAKMFDNIRISALASAATLGTAMSGMLLGHRYLTAPGMPLAPLYRLNDMLGLASLLRMGISILNLAESWHSLSDSTYVIWLALRWLAGIAGPLAVWYMVRRILVYKNTQSATGVLFVGVILTFIGELTGDLLYRTTGVPF